MNKKGFTLIELLAVIVVLGIVLVISIPNLTATFQKSKLKSEETFVKRLSQTIDSYVSLHSGEMTFRQESGQWQKSLGVVKKDDKEVTNYEDVDVFKVGETIYFQNIIDSELMTSSEFINAGNKEKCDSQIVIEVYRDNDYVYCHKVKAEGFNCLSQAYKDKLTTEQFPNGKGINDTLYAIDTCVWKKK